MPLLSFIMPVKDGAVYLGEAVRSIQEQALRDWELIVVDDHSADDTARLVLALGASDRRIALVNNSGRGKVQAVNHGYAFCGGDFLKVVDADDLLAPGFSEAFARLRKAPATYHDALLLDDRSGGRSRIRVGGRYAAMSLEQSLRRIRVSPPFWSWTLARSVADRVFPLPADVPFPHEDVFFGLTIKKASRVSYVPLPLYIYRQHPGQSYGGLFDFSPELVGRRAAAMLGIIDAVEASDIARGFADPAGLLASSRTYFSLLGREGLTWRDIVGARLGLAEKARVAVVRKAPRAASWLSRRRAAGRLKDLNREKAS
jgi:glycosyltransferase involved in cell wall biosynthesis